MYSRGETSKSTDHFNNLEKGDRGTSKEKKSEGVQPWGISFEKLLEDPEGIQTFAIFLQKEFSAENIYFWAACERYRNHNDHARRRKEANEIYSKYLAANASDPVNVDSKARNYAKENLTKAEENLFSQVNDF